MTATDGIIIGKAAAPVVLDPRYANRLKLVAGVTLNRTGFAGGHLV